MPHPIGRIDAARIGRSSVWVQPSAVKKLVILISFLLALHFGIGIFFVQLVVMRGAPGERWKQEKEQGKTLHYGNSGGNSAAMQLQAASGFRYFHKR